MAWDRIPDPLEPTSPMRGMRAPPALVFAIVVLHSAAFAEILEPRSAQLHDERELLDTAPPSPLAPSSKDAGASRQLAARLCPAGRYHSANNRTRCLDCPAGKWQSATGASA